jgi:hypothetical protein
MLGEIKKRTQLVRRLFAAAGIGVSLLFLSVNGFVLAQVSPDNIVTYQGRILNANGVPVADASLNMQFRLFDDVAAGSCLWSNDSSTCASDADKSVTLTDGLFSENLGDTSAGYASIPDSVFADNAAVYLEVEIAGETLSPRKLMTAAPYALNAQTLDGLDSTDFSTITGSGTDTHAARWDGTGALQDSNVVIDDGATAFEFLDGGWEQDTTTDIYNLITTSSGTGVIQEEFRASVEAYLSVGDLSTGIFDFRYNASNARFWTGAVPTGELIAGSGLTLKVGTEGAQTVVFGTINLARVTVHASGNVGIGTSSPDGLLDL